MNWIDYREKLGVSYSSEELFNIIYAKIINSIIYDEIADYTGEDFFNFCMIVGLSCSHYRSYFPSPKKALSEVFRVKVNSTKDLVSYYIAYVQARELNDNDKSKLINTLQEYLRDVHCEFEIYKDQDGYYLFPIGAEILDKYLVSEPLIWLADYPQTQKTFSIALKQYSDKIFTRDIADNFRKALEDFFKEFLHNSKNLENNIPLIGAYLKENGASEEIAKILVGLVNLYSTLNNKIAKHHDNVDSKFLEFLMYQTGLFIRMLIVVRRESK
ncbi:MAG: hypothetical protein CVV04_05210 [Firmicutes bacterium HGW-Firmicutes-9]|jgi:hypothetical protein|nr:MAG: hypothetical protein CVV04_05210 [Firmicutes bacterium HGW-Firmicutes-9]